MNTLLLGVNKVCFQVDLFYKAWKVYLYGFTIIRSLISTNEVLIILPKPDMTDIYKGLKLLYTIFQKYALSICKLIRIKFALFRAAIPRLCQIFSWQSVLKLQNHHHYVPEGILSSEEVLHVKSFTSLELCGCVKNTEKQVANSSANVLSVLLLS